ncbi:uncharacterized protein LOC100186835 [Ciona intestinalis]
MEQDDEYIKQLEGIFNEFRDDDKTGLNESQLQGLCKRLQLNDQCIERIFHLSLPTDHKPNPDLCNVSFERFCESFVAVLSEVNDDVSNGDDDVIKEPHVEEVKPRLVRGGRAYGRKSVPHIHANLEEDVNYSVNEEGQGNDKPATVQWSADIMISSDETELDNNRYYDAGYTENGTYFEANGLNQPMKIPMKEKNETKFRKALLSTDNNDSLNDFSSASIILNEVNKGTFFSALDYDNSGSVELKHVCELWKEAGVENPMLILEALDFEESYLDGHQLSTVLEKEALSLIPTVTGNMDLCSNTVIALIASYRSQLFHLNNQVDQNRSEADKMREDLERSEIRNSKLVEEVDDRYLSMDQQNERKMSGMERKWVKKLSSAQRGFEREREAMMATSDREREIMQKEIDNLKSTETSLRRKLELLRSENDSLSAESSRVGHRLSESEKDAERLRKDLECLLTAKTCDTHNMNTSQEEKFAMIIKEYEAHCRLLSDRNDELAIEVEELRGRIRQEEAVREHNITLKDDLSPKRKKALRRGSTSEYLDRTSQDYSDMESDGISMGEGLEVHHRFSHPDQSSDHFTRMRMEELERQLEDLKEERKLRQEEFMEEKALLKAELQKDYQLKLESVKSSLPQHNDDNRAIEEQQIMTMQLLKEMTQQKDELEAKYIELKETSQSHAENGQQDMADLCREFANEKSDLLAKHEQQMNEMEAEITIVTQQLSEEQRANQRKAALLESERLQHSEALVAHQDIIAKFEKSSSSVSEDHMKNKISTEKLEEVMKEHQAEITRLKQEHREAVERLRDDLQSKLDKLLSEKQQFMEKSSMCSELERLEESIQVERKEMEDRMQGLREEFERDAVELRRLLDCDKAKLRKQLSEETAKLRLQLAEETERELKRKRQLMEEGDRLERQNMQKKEKESIAIDEMQSEIEDLQARNKYLDDMLSKTRICLEEEEKKSKELKVKMRAELSTEEMVGELNMKIREKEETIISLKSQLSEQLDCSREKVHEMSLLQTDTEVMEAENSQLKKENLVLVGKVRNLEKERLSNRIENAGLTAKCEHLSAPVPSPRNKYKRLEEERSRERRKAEEKIEELKKEIELLQSSSPRGSDANPPPRSRLFTPDGENDTGCCSDTGSSTSNGSEGAMDSMRARLHKTRSQLTDQMRKTRDVYNKLSKNELLVKDLYCENAHLMRALQVTEARQKDAEKKLQEETDKTQVLGRLLKQICPDVV